MKFKNLSQESKVRAALRSNLRHWFRQASTDEFEDGLQWYKRANDACKFMSHMAPMLQVAGTVSALSPNNKWARNLQDAANVLAAVVEDRPADSVKVCTYNANKLKAFEIARGNQQILRQSPKTYAFAKNVGELDPEFVTVDVWHLRACQTRSLSRKKVAESVTPLQYRIIAEETKKVAQEFGLKGYEFQAIVWVTIRNRWTT